MTLQPTLDPFLDGVHARHAGAPRSDCPYPQETEEGVAWESGWDEGGGLDEDGEAEED